ncbi:MAG TPA: alpha/beta fold hydrolase [Solirubrobacteraceae bacterium]|jgi:pimeloyl-ACP methyl ester carboxylesterase
MLSIAPFAGAQVTRDELDVPLDHADPRGATLELAYARVPARGAARGTIVFLAGGPGEAAVRDARVIGAEIQTAAGRGYEVVVVDQRGAGRSTALSCPSLRRLKDADTVAEAAGPVMDCGARLGPARAFFSTYETALDVEDLRARLGVDEIIPLGVSYGGQVAGEYARRFPDHVQALILDSSSPLEGVDLMARLTQLALPRVLDEICFTPDCERILGDTRVLLARAIEVIGARGLRGITRGVLYDLVRGADQDPLIRAELPAALQAATHRDAAPLLRLLRYSEGGGAAGVNQARFLATSCMEGQLPWAPDSDPRTRPTLFAETLLADAASYAPFPVRSILARIPASLCVSWPATPRPPLPSSAGPDVPVLVLAGREDLRTPLEDQRRIAAQFPAAQLLSVPGVGHSVLGTDLSGCAARAVRQFLAGDAIETCGGRRAAPLDVALPAFRSLREVPRPAGDVPARIARTAVAVDLTLRDAERWATAAALSARRRVPGLRGGRLEVRRRGVRLIRYEVVRGVRVSGTLAKGPDAIVVTGSGATGTLRIVGGRVRGVLDGRRITYRPLAPRPRAAGAVYLSG